MRRVKLGRQLTGEQRIVEPPAKRRAFLRFDAYRLLKEDGRMSVEMIVKCAAEQLAKAFTDQGYPMRPIPAYEEEIEEIARYDDPVHEFYEDWPDGVRRTRYLHFGLPKS